MVKTVRVINTDRDEIWQVRKTLFIGIVMIIASFGLLLAPYGGVCRAIGVLMLLLGVAMFLYGWFDPARG